MVSSNSASSIANASTLCSLPSEILDEVFTHLSNRDFKTLRLTSSFLRDAVPFHLDRVFLSANPRNIEVFRSIADDENVRKRIVEIIWDDATLRKYAPPQEWTEDPDLVWLSKDNCPQWFRDGCRTSFNDMFWRKGEDVDRPDHLDRQRQRDHVLPYADCWAYYETLVQQQEHVISTGADEAALRYGLKRFPSLQRITITPSAHGFIYENLFDTPMIRDFPYGFNYPIPRGWSFGGEDEMPEEHAWNDSSELFKDRWRGFRIITRILAREDHKITELVLNPYGLELGLNHHILDEMSDEYVNFAMVLSRPGFRRIDLALTVQDAREYNWLSYRSGCLRAALARATNLEHISLRSDVRPDHSYPDPDDEDATSFEDFIPLRTVFPVHKWPNLRHFGLSRFMVKQDDVLALLSALPETLQSVELSYLLFVDGGGNYHDLLNDMRDTLGWKERKTRPRVIMAVESSEFLPARDLWINKELASFMYRGGENPFGGLDNNKVYQGCGMLTDQFNPAFDRPYLHFVELAQLGIRKMGQREREIIKNGTMVKDCIESDIASRDFFVNRNRERNGQ